MVQYGSELEYLARSGISESRQRMNDTLDMVNAILQSQRGPSMSSPIARSRRSNRGPRTSGPPMGMNTFNGPFIREVHDPLRSTSITSDYGWRINPVSGERSFHTGLDLSAPQGTPIRAAATGIIRRKGVDDIYGKRLVIGHGKGFRTEYDHMARMIVRKGQRVRRGQIIGYVGSTGWSTGPHLHWTIYKGRKTIDPRRFLRGR